MSRGKKVLLAKTFRRSQQHVCVCVCGNIHAFYCLPVELVKTEIQGDFYRQVS